MIYIFYNYVSNNLLNVLLLFSSLKQENPEFPYIDEVQKEVLEGKHIFIDSRKRSLFSIYLHF